MGEYKQDRTTWVDVSVELLDDNDDATGDEWEFKMEIDPDPPSCEDGFEHEWERPHEIVGGIKENPGVWGHGGGCYFTEVCRYCGKFLKTDTWATNPENGEQGLDSVSYEDASEESAEWARKNVETEHGK